MGYRRIDSGRDPLILARKGSVLVIACDSFGAIGAKKFDRVKVGARLVGKFAVRVPMMEVLSLGAAPLSISVAICSEPEPTGRLILEGISEELKRARLNATRVISSEKNVKTSQTAVGVTVIAGMDQRSLRLGKSRRNDILVSFGRTCVREEVLEGHRQGSIADLRDMRWISNLGYIHDCIPVGSKGIIHEASVLARDSGTIPVLEADTAELSKSAGPATSLLLSMNPRSFDNLRRTTNKKIRRVGKLA